ncbi:family 2A encapsulin nanocompartment cargo protein cysteine desulfurase [Rubrivivax gelatinosus]|uniref:cysteine desulfurase n=1 Tax=Rubrivivax gelatinosus TaxID=28068 RepID=A0A4R2M8A5_RUBGE|nr:family 2A encapsulin nanocompartment cargo protein cysteine desulfurase [Rubrivivax gelatinosus]MBK1689102.1 cysteine desulfurase [Rubrivivax gelatinosus]TCP03539.1 cysteine desulfurase /L-selenocysteine selenide-lyase (L-alanine-forming) [Rubrivivax gelatinosus]
MTTPEIPAAALPPGLPDPAQLARLANEFFSHRPATGGVPLPEKLHPAGLTLPPGSFGPSTPAAIPGGPPPGAHLLPTSPQSAANLGASWPARVPHAPAGNGVPETLFATAPACDGRLGSHLLAVPQASPFLFAEAQALGVPHAAPPPPAAVVAAAAATPRFYFVPEAAAERRPPFAEAAPPLDVHAVRRDFPLLAERVSGRPLVWLDNAATTQKPQAVIDRLAHFYTHENSNIHRAAHTLAARATDAYEHARETVRRFIGAASTGEIVFVRGATEAINLVAAAWGCRHVGAGDEIVVSHLEHHANIVPWKRLADERGATLRVIPVDDSGQVRLDEYQRLLNERTRIVAVTQVSNALGTVVPVAEIVAIARRAGIRTLVDGAQSVSHLKVDVQALGADFFVFSGHKVFGPTGIGVLHGRREVLEDLAPWQGGGNMIADVSFQRVVYQPPPARFEAGTGNIADAVGLGAALEYVERIGIENIAQYEHGLLEYATGRLAEVPGLRPIGTARDKASVLSFVLAGYSTDEVGQALNREGIAVRTGHHCAQPILRRFGLETTVRPSLAFYNTCEEIDLLVTVLHRLAAARPVAGRQG